jgi:hypothetical protein
MTTDNILSVKVKKGDKSIVTVIGYYYPELKRNRDEEIIDIPHQDFNAALSELTKYISQIYHSEITECYQATGFKYLHDNIVILTGKMVSDAGTTAGISTPSINLENDSYGFEMDLKEDLNKLCYESLLFLNGSKQGVKQLTIDDAIKEDVEVEKNTQELNDELTEETREEEDDALNNDPPENDEFLFDNK